MDDMKPIATIDGKTDMSTTEIAPVTIVQPEGKKRGITGKHVLIAGTVVLAVLIVVCGFVAATVLLKQTATHANEQLADMAKTYSVRVNDGKETTEEEVKTNTGEKTTETTDKDKDGNKKQTVYHDFKRSVTLYISYRPGETDHCYVAPLNKSSEMSPAVLQKYLEDHPNPEMETKEDKSQDRIMEPSEEPIEDTGFLGQRINDLCRGRSIYWLFPEPENEMEASTATTTPASRQKRALPYCPWRRLIILGSYPRCSIHCCLRYVCYRRYNYWTRKYYNHWVGYGCIRHLTNRHYFFCPIYG